ncbi:hypothetical protein D3C76_1524160 [compost metagenome]
MLQALQHGFNACHRFLPGRRVHAVGPVFPEQACGFIRWGKNHLGAACFIGITLIAPGDKTQLLDFLQHVIGRPFADAQGLAQSFIMDGKAGFVVQVNQLLQELHPPRCQGHAASPHFGFLGLFGVFVS